MNINSAISSIAISPIQTSRKSNTTSSDSAIISSSFAFPSTSNFRESTNEFASVATAATSANNLKMNTNDTIGKNKCTKSPLPQQTTPITTSTASDLYVPPPLTQQGLKRDHRSNYLQQQQRKTHRSRALGLFEEESCIDHDVLQLNDDNDENVNNVDDRCGSSITGNSYSVSTMFMDSENDVTGGNSSRNRFNISTSFMDSEGAVAGGQGERGRGRSEFDEVDDTNRIYISEIQSVPSDEREYYESTYEKAAPHSIHQNCNDEGRQEDEDDNNNNCNGDDEEHSLIEVDVGEEEQEEENIQEREETEEERRQREEAESEALARQLMAEEAMASYNQSSDFLRAHASEYSEEDLRALEALMAEEDPMIQEEEIGDNGVYGGEEGEVSRELSYETLLRLGERMGDVKTERWAMRAQQEIAKLKTIKFDLSMAKGKDENDCCVKCLVCQFQYEEGETIRVLPCGHRFHDECVDQWLSTKDHCPYCRQSIVE